MNINTYIKNKISMNLFSAYPFSPGCIWRIEKIDLNSNDVEVSDPRNQSHIFKINEIINQFTKMDGTIIDPPKSSTGNPSPQKLPSSQINWGDESINVFTPKTQACTHTWKHYKGFTESYDYCEICDLKRNEK